LKSALFTGVFFVLLPKFPTIQMTQHNCLNCETELIGKFCSNCGQKSDTHRITLKHFLFHDILHGVWHIEKGILFTIKEALIRPGKAAIDYISGKRISYYNIFYLILLLIGLNIFLKHQYDVILNEPQVSWNTNDVGDKISYLIDNNAKGLILPYIPFFAISSFLFFRRKKLNISEHFILSGMTFLGILIPIIISNCFMFLEFTENFKVVSRLSNSYVLPAIILIQLIYSYTQAFSKDYSKIGFVFRMLLFLLFILIETFLFLVLIYIYANNWKL
jgi:hypothetical protein